jgi:hypothetical protein
MPVQSFSIADIIPNLQSGLIKYVSNVYDETFGLGGMAPESPLQLEQKIRVRGKIFYRPVADDIPEYSEAEQIKDTNFTDEMFAAPTYGKAFAITVDDLIVNSEYAANFTSIRDARIGKSQVPRLSERVNVASNLAIDMIKRSKERQVKQLLETGTLQFNHNQAIDFGRDPGNSETITTANLKWTIANKSTMTPIDDINRWVTQVSDRGNSGASEMYVLMGRSAYTSFQNSDQYADDSNQRRNYRIEMRPITAASNKNIPNGAFYRESIIRNTTNIVHIFTYNQTYTDLSTPATPVSTQWLDDDKVYVIAGDNIFENQPVNIPIMDVYARNAFINRMLAAVPSMRGWLVKPEWNKTSEFALVMGVYRKHLTLMHTPNKTFNAITNS